MICLKSRACIWHLNIFRNHHVGEEWLKILCDFCLFSFSLFSFSFLVSFILPNIFLFFKFTINYAYIWGTYIISHAWPTHKSCLCRTARTGARKGWSGSRVGAAAHYPAAPSLPRLSGSCTCTGECAKHENFQNYAWIPPPSWNVRQVRIHVFQKWF